jgi:hypothetical protein
MSFVFAIWGTVHASPSEHSESMSSVPSQNHSQVDPSPAVHSCCSKKTASVADTPLGQSTQAQSQDSHNCCEGHKKCGGAMACCKVLYDLASHLNLWVPQALIPLVDDASTPLHGWISEQFRPPRPDRALFA